MELAEILGQVLPVQVEDDGALTVTHAGTVASLRSMEFAEGLNMVWLMQIVARDLPLTAELRDRVAAEAAKTMFGTITLAEQQAGNRGDVMLRYIFPAEGLEDRALQALVLAVLVGGAEAAEALTAAR